MPQSWYELLTLVMVFIWRRLIHMRVHLIFDQFGSFLFPQSNNILGLEICTKHQTKPDVKTAINVRCKVSLYLTVMTDMFCAVKNTLLMMQYFILMRINFCFTLYNFPHNLLCSFLPPLVETVKEFKEFFNYSFFVIFFSTL